ncbi:APC family permease [Acidisoma cellulosilytica]|uniref:APC family permease n=1 Tax=Acidisoma cellulosilyticum TaxID=2802395 RepID=A0A963Z242_9PROT|nr:APC family permease [Acidisoma cellulosilyticum]MCB8881443.1 APC family permease [Acidisoma cellulosilyticum]
MAELRKNAISLFGAIAATCAFMGPATSVYFNTGLGIQNAGNAIGFALILAMVATFFIAFVIAQFAKQIPTAGFAYTFAVRGLGPKVGFVTGWLLVGGYAMLAPMLLAAIGYFLAQFLAQITGISLSWAVYSVIVAALILFLACRGIGVSVKVAIVMLLVEIVVMMLFFLTVLIHGGGQGIALTTFNPASAPASGSLNGIGTAVLWFILMFVGFESAATMGEETRDPKHNIPRALMLCVGGIGIFYLVSALAAVTGYGPSHVKDVLGAINKGGNPWDPLFHAFWGHGAGIVVQLVVLNSIFANLLAGFNSVIRILYAMGRERVLPPVLGEVSGRQVPAKAAVLYMALSLALTLILGFTWDPMTVYGWAGTVLGLAIVLVYIVICASLFAFYRRRGAEFSWIKHALVPLIATLLLLLPLKGVLMSTLPVGGGTAPMTAVPYVVGIWIVFGVLYSLWLARFRKSVMTGMGRAFE